MAIRKSVRDLSISEKNEFTDAVLALKAEPSPIISGVNSYDRYVVMHQQSMDNLTPWPSDPRANPRPTMRNSAHRGPAFLPWHRQFLGQFEKDLQRISGNPNLGLPYWDWEIDSTFPDFLGGDGVLFQFGIAEPIAFWFAVQEGPFSFDTETFSGWIAADVNGAGVAPLQRRFGTEEVAKRDPITHDVIRDATGAVIMVPVTLPSKKDVEDVLLLTEYDDGSWDEAFDLKTFRNVLEGWWRGPALHNQVHVWVAGSMGPGTSPNDPTFFLHHCNIDRIWAEWQSQPTSGQYEPQAGGPPGHNLRDPMFPWDGVATPDRVTPEMMLSLGNVTYASPPAP